MSLLKLLPGEPPWGEADAVLLRDFLQTGTGQLFLQRLLYARTAVSANEGERRRIEQDERTGFEQCIAEVFLLADPRQPNSA